MRNIVTLVFVLISFVLFPQDDLLSEIDTVTEARYEIATFKALKIVNLETTKMVPKKTLFFVVAHRFGSIKTGIGDFFGLDQAVTRLNFIYGITDGVNLGISRSSFKKTYEGSLKIRLLRQQKGRIPITMALFNSLQLNGSLSQDNLPRLETKHRWSYASQLLVSSKINKTFSVELAPTLFHDNLTSIDEQENTQYALGLGGRYKISNRVSLNCDYAFHLNRFQDSPFVNPLSLGVDIETGGHVFQLHFSNAQPMNVNNYIGQATGDWGKADIYFGFNLVRVF
ncbi:DUF5777 family beta-barrel protein [Maribacter sp. CXY002]|uniref:DUF5777 family beta-barrel protein n=1 Tax=Maribacter luteocoastalis TaxID=3407671 RepID=UPI003B67E068